MEGRAWSRETEVQKSPGQRDPGTKKHRGCLCGGRQLGEVSVSGRTGMPGKAINTSQRHGSL